MDCSSAPNVPIGPLGSPAPPSLINLVIRNRRLETSRQGAGSTHSLPPWGLPPFDTNTQTSGNADDTPIVDWNDYGKGWFITKDPCVGHHMGQRWNHDPRGVQGPRGR